MRKQHCSVDIVACICCACSGCSAHIVYGSDELRCYLKIVSLFICLLGHNLIQYSQFHLTKLWIIFLNRYIFSGFFECSPHLLSMLGHFSAWCILYLAYLL